MKYSLNTPIAKRSTKTVYRDGDHSIKLFVKGYSKADILNEALNQARVEEGTDLYIPKLIEVTTIDEQWALVSEYVEGTPLDVLMDKNPDKLDEYLSLFVDIQMTVHSKRVPLLSRIKDKFTRKLESTTLINDSVKYELLQRLDGMKNHAKLCHGDFQPSNVIITDSGKYHIIDWAHATQGNASADVARTFLTFSMQGKGDVAEKYLDKFCAVSGIDKRNIQRWIPIVAATQLTKGIESEREFLSKWIDVLDFE